MTSFFHEPGCTRGLSLVILAVLCALSVAVNAATPADLGKVNLLTSMDQYQEALMSCNVTMVNFHTPSCGHCKRLVPDYEEAAKLLKPHQIYLYDVNCVDHENICQLNNVEGYPTLITFHKGRKYAEFKSRAPEAIVDHLVRLNQPPIKELNNVEELRDLMAANYTKFVGVFKDVDSSESAAFTEFAENNRERATFLRAVFKEAFNELGLDAQDTAAVVCLKFFDNKKSILKQQDITADGLKHFVFVELLPILGHINPDTFSMYVDAELPIGFIFFLKEEDLPGLSKDLSPIATKYKGKMSFAFVDGFEHGHHADSLGLKQETFPALAVHDFLKNMKFPMDQTLELSGKNVDTFIESILDGRVKPYYVSEALPVENAGPLKIVVHDNFDSLILNEQTDAVLDLYAPWCQACKRLAPQLEAFAEKYLNRSDVLTFGKLNLERNDFPQGVDLKFDHIPAIFMFPAKDKQHPVKYDGDFSFDSLKEFVVKFGSNGVLPLLEEVSVEHPIIIEDQPQEAPEEEHIEL